MVDKYKRYYDFALNEMADLIPHDDPEYNEKLHLMAKNYADAETYGYDDEFLDIHTSEEDYPFPPQDPTEELPF